MAKKWGRGWLCGGVLLLAGAVIGYLLLVLVYCLPTERMQQHLESCVDAFAQGAVSLVKDDTGMWVDYLTDSVILAEAVYNGEESLWEQAAAVYSSGPEEGGGKNTVGVSQNPGCGGRNSQRGRLRQILARKPCVSETVAVPV